jgi:hypothetical protein
MPPLKPANLSHIEAAAVPLAGLTAWQALFEIGGLKAGQKVLIHGGSGGVGSFAIQLARHAGADGRHHRRRAQRRAGPQPRRRHRHRLQGAALRGRRQRPATWSSTRRPATSSTVPSPCSSAAACW